MESDIKLLSEECRMDFKNVYDKYPDAVNSLTGFPGEIGVLAKICIACGTKI